MNHFRATVAAETATCDELPDNRLDQRGLYNYLDTLEKS
jgi:hypothetical protein